MKEMVSLRKFHPPPQIIISSAHIFASKEQSSQDSEVSNG